MKKKARRKPGFFLSAILGWSFPDQRLVNC
jgi:hypothetical protein